MKKIRRLVLGLLVCWGSAAIAAPATFPEAPPPLPATVANVTGGVRAVLVHGSTMYVGGNFRVSQGGVTRRNLAAFDFAGNLRPEFTAEPDGRVMALATDGVSLFVGGEFARLELKKRLAAVDLVTGKVNRQFTAHIGGVMTPDAPTSVRALAVVSDPSTQPPTVRLIVGGNFNKLDSTAGNRPGLGAVTIDSGELDTVRFTQGVQGGLVDALLASSDRQTVYVGGAFTSAQGRSGSLVAMGPTGALLSGSFRNGTEPVIDLDLDETNNRLFAASGGANNRPIAMVATGTSRGQILWRGPRVGGDVQAIHQVGGNVYFGFHDGLFAEPDPYKLAAVDAATGTFIADAASGGLTCSALEEERPNCWLPTLDSSTGGQGFFGVWVIQHLLDPSTGRTKLVVGGEFTQVGAVTNTRRLAIFPEIPPPPPPPPPPDPPAPPAP